MYMIRWLARAFAAVPALLLPAAMATAQPQVSGVRIGLHGDTTRFVIDLSDPVRYRAFTLANPYRVVLDLPELIWNDESQSLPAKSGLIQAYRSGLFTPGITRVVLDVTAPIKIARTFILDPQSKDGDHRLVVDISRVSQSEFEQIARTRRVPPPPAARTPIPDTPPPQGETPVVVIDAGHGGVDPGAIGRSGTREKTLTLTMAKELKALLDSTGRYKVVLTRDKDYYIPLRERVALGRAAGGSLFISLHADTIRRQATRGASVYTLSETASDKEAAALAAKENRSDVIAGVDLSHENDDVANILIDLAQRETMNLSAQFAAILVEELGKRTRLLRNTHRFAGFAVLKAPDIPSVLVELGYLSNKTDEGLLRSKKHRATLAAGIVKAVDRFFEHTGRLTRS